MLAVSLALLYRYALARMRMNKSVSIKLELFAEATTSKKRNPTYNARTELQLRQETGYHEYENATPSSLSCLKPIMMVER